MADEKTERVIDLGVWSLMGMTKHPRNPPARACRWQHAEGECEFRMLTRHSTSGGSEFPVYPPFGSVDDQAWWNVVRPSAFSTDHQPAGWRAGLWLPGASHLGGKPSHRLGRMGSGDRPCRRIEGPGNRHFAMEPTQIARRTSRDGDQPEVPRGRAGVSTGALYAYRTCGGDNGSWDRSTCAL